MTAWQRGLAAVERLLSDRDLEAVPASGEVAHRLMDEAGRHLRSAAAVVGSDPTGALQLAYDAARKAATALLAAQGLRPTTTGGHRAVADAVAAQFGGAFDRLDRLRRRRNDAEYPDADRPTVNVDDAQAAIASADAMREAAAALLESGQLGIFSR